MAEIKAAKDAARRVFSKYNFKEGPLGSYQISSLLKDVYEFLKMPFTPTQNDLQGYQKVLDVNRDGKVTLDDLQALAIEYLCGGGIAVKQGARDGQASYSGAGGSSSGAGGISSGAGGSDYENMGYNYQLKSANEPYSSSRAAYNYAQSSSNSNGNVQFASSKYQAGISSHNNQYQVASSNMDPAKSDTSYGNYNNNPQMGVLNEWGGKTAVSYVDSSKISSNSNSYNQALNMSQANQNESYRSIQYSEVVSPNEGYNLNSGVNFSSSFAANNEPREYSEIIREYLKAVGQIFMQYADGESYTVTENEVPELLSDTYAVLGREGYYPTQQDVQAWMRLCDVDYDGRVDYQDYQYFVLKSLQKSGIDLYE